MKTDDDMFINVPALVKALKARTKTTGTLMGCLICNAKPITDPKNKWQVENRYDRIYRFIVFFFFIYLKCDINFLSLFFSGTHQNTCIPNVLIQIICQEPVT